jgi:hypothetical protein
VAIRQDRSSTGHILGHAQAQQQNVTSVRNLTHLSCGVLRCLTHVAMLLGTDQNIQVYMSIEPVKHISSARSEKLNLYFIFIMLYNIFLINIFLQFSVIEHPNFLNIV